MICDIELAALLKSVDLIVFKYQENINNAKTCSGYIPVCQSTKEDAEEAISRPFPIEAATVRMLWLGGRCDGDTKPC